MDQGESKSASSRGSGEAAKRADEGKGNLETPELGCSLATTMWGRAFHLGFLGLSEVNAGSSFCRGPSQKPGAQAFAQRKWHM